MFSEDETQIYLLGLKYHSTHAWPYFGPDIVWTKSQIPGALQALLSGLPLDVVALPEAPYVLINLLSMGALCLFASYLSARLPTTPRWLIFGWLLTLPWTLNYSTHIMNPGYVLPASLMFFLGFFEAWPSLRIGRVGIPLAHALMGAAIAWIAQVHMSWTLLLPSAICGALAVALLIATILPVWGRVAGVTAGIALAVTPSMLAVSRSTNPDANTGDTNPNAHSDPRTNSHSGQRQLHRA